MIKPLSSVVVAGKADAELQRPNLAHLKEKEMDAYLMTGVKRL